jgi:hypothetical protein
MVNFSCQEITEERHVRITDPATSTDWDVFCPRTMYVFRQKVRTRFSDPMSFSPADRQPPRTLAAATAFAEPLSKIDLPHAVSSIYQGLQPAAKVGVWMAEQFTVAPTDPAAGGVFNVDVDMVAYSDYIWNRSAFRKKKIQTAAEVTTSSPEA